jgi:hypothetical protein
MAATDLVQLFESLVAPMPATTGTDLAAIPVPGAETHRVAKDASGFPCLLIRQPPHVASAPPIRLENLLVSFDIPCSVSHPGGKHERDTFTIVKCTAANPALFPHFLRILSPMIAALGQAPTRAAVRRAIGGLVELFQALSAPPRKTIQGVWAELMLIRLASDPQSLAAAWHRDPVEHFDFASGPQRIEVKSSSLRRRVHHFSQGQLTASQGIRVLVASLFVERSGGGMSMRGLFESVRELLEANAELTAHLDAIFYASLGSGWEEAMDEAFDWELARDSLELFGAESVPGAEISIPAGVSEVRFCSDLSLTTPVRRDELLRDVGIFAAAAPVSR